MALELARAGCNIVVNYASSSTAADEVSKKRKSIIQSHSELPCLCRLCKSSSIDLTSLLSFPLCMQTVNEIKALGVDAIAYKADMSKYEEVEAMFKHAASHWTDPVNILVNNAGR